MHQISGIHLRARSRKLSLKNCPRASSHCGRARMAQGFRARMNNFHSVLIEVLNTAQISYCRKVFCVIAYPCVLTSVPMWEHSGSWAASCFSIIMLNPGPKIQKWSIFHSYLHFNGFFSDGDGRDEALPGWLSHGLGAEISDWALGAGSAMAPWPWPNLPIQNMN